jgi:NAD(P)-dependent dehydrogenase (short-subunit alcohol dehydrogenase family)
MVNFVGHRHLTENLLTKMKEGSAIANVASMAGAGWKSNRETVKALVATKDFDEARAWLAANEEKNRGYFFSKQCLIFYTHKRAAELAAKGIRINCLSPITTVTPMIEKFEAYAGKEFMWKYFRAPCDRYATPEEMAEPLIFLNSNMARFVSGQNLIVDYGYWGDVESGQRKSLVG